MRNSEDEQTTKKPKLTLDISTLFVNSTLNEKVDYKSIAILTQHAMESLLGGGVYKGSAQGTAMAATFEKDYNKMAPALFPSFAQTI